MCLVKGACFLMRNRNKIKIHFCMHKNAAKNDKMIKATISTRNLGNNNNNNNYNNNNNSRISAEYLVLFFVRLC